MGQDQRDPDVPVPLAVSHPLDQTLEDAPSELVGPGEQAAVEPPSVVPLLNDWAALDELTRTIWLLNERDRPRAELIGRSPGPPLDTEVTCAAGAPPVPFEEAL